MSYPKRGPEVVPKEKKKKKALAGKQRGILRVFFHPIVAWWHTASIYVSSDSAKDHSLHVRLASLFRQLAVGFTAYLSPMLANLLLDV